MVEAGCSHDAHFQNLEVSKDQTVSGYSTFSNGVSNPTGLLAPTITAKEPIPPGFNGALVKNKHYLSPNDGNNITATLPTQANSTAGDVIIVEYHTLISNSQTHRYGTSGEFFMQGSALYKKAGLLQVAVGIVTFLAVGLIDSVDIADGTGDDFLNLVGPVLGIGSYVVFTFNGSKWRAEARCTASGTGSGANLSEFATS